MINHGSPLYEQEHKEQDDKQDDNDDRDDYQYQHAATSSCGFGGCFRLFGYSSTRRQSNNNDYQRKYYLLQQEGGRHKEMTWWRKKLNKVKVYTEVLSGPRWKNFIRKNGGYCKTMKQKQKNRLSKKQKKKNTRFQYSLNGYELNFDGGVDRGDDTVPNFASRFAAPMTSEHVP